MEVEHSPVHYRLRGIPGKRSYELSLSGRLSIHVLTVSGVALEDMSTD